uniref:Sulfotransferase n=1 Tax=Cyprinus carpio carpio TaxID=630221 RepID=A0A8C1AA75_CYPCA
MSSKPVVLSEVYNASNLHQIPVFFLSRVLSSGEVGDWKNNFSDTQSKQMDELFQDKLAGTNLGARLKYDLYCQ